mmetsp:Transcript_14576/g.18431  ORF Transcript_14576/g.18431 Transcript_14576/m.18431 type:complete len:199 (-) Transcript_14576:170-766(-)
MRPISPSSIVISVLLLVQYSSIVQGFSMLRTSGSSRQNTNPITHKEEGIIPSSSCLQMAPGGWGIGNPLDFKDEEFSSSKSSRRRRRRRRKDSAGGDGSNDSAEGAIDEVAYNAETAERIEKVFSMENAQQFTQRVQNERNNLQLQKKKDLMEVARIAGLGDRIKPKVNSDSAGKEGLGKFDFEDDDDDLDVRVQWEN